MSSESKDFLEAGIAVKSEAPKILADWEQMVLKRIPTAGRTNHVSLRDSLPEFMSGLAKALERPRSLGREHGTDRAQSAHYSLDQVLVEYQILREVMFDSLNSKASLSLRVAQFIHTYLDQAIRTATTEYLKLRESNDRENVERANRIVQEYRYQLESTLSNMPIAVAFLEGPELLYTYTNVEHSKLVEDRDVIGKTLDQIVPPSERKKLWELLRGVYETGSPVFQDEALIHLYDGAGHAKQFFLRVSYQPLRKLDGTIYGVAATVVNVTDRVLARKTVEANERALQAAEDQLNLALAGARMGTWHIDLTTQVVTTSKTFAGIFGVPEVTGNIFEEISRYMHPDDVAEVNRMWTDAVEKKQPYLHEYRIVWPDGSIRWVESRGSMKQDENGDFTIFSGVLIDVTADVTARRKLQELVETLEEERDVRERFVSALTHDLRTPLTSTKMMAQLLMRKKPTPDVEMMLSRPVLQMGRADRMIRDLLDASRLKAGQSIALLKVDCNLHQLIEVALRDLTDVYGKRFVLNHAQDDLTGHWDGEAMRRIIENLASNAIKYGDDEAPVTISVSSDLEFTRLSVHNEGEPIPLAQQKDLFQPYRRIDTEQSEKHKGWGIGLTLVKGLAEAHGGFISMVSNPQDGTTFTLAIPRYARAHT